MPATKRQGERMPSFMKRRVVVLRKLHGQLIRMCWSFLTAGVLLLVTVAIAACYAIGIDEQSVMLFCIVRCGGICVIQVICLCISY